MKTTPPQSEGQVHRTIGPPLPLPNSCCRGVEELKQSSPSIGLLDEFLSKDEESLSDTQENKFTDKGGPTNCSRKLRKMSERTNKNLRNLSVTGCFTTGE